MNLKIKSKKINEFTYELSILAAWKDIKDDFELCKKKVAKNIKFLVIDQKTGKKADFGSKTTIIEAFKKEDLPKNFDNNNNLNLKVNKNNILKFY